MSLLFAYKMNQQFEMKQVKFNEENQRNISTLDREDEWKWRKDEDRRDKILVCRE